MLFFIHYAQRPYNELPINFMVSAMISIDLSASPALLASAMVSPNSLKQTFFLNHLNIFQMLLKLSASVLVYRTYLHYETA